MPALGWTRTRSALECVGRHPVTTVWIGLQLNLLAYDLTYERATTVEGMNHGLWMAGVVSLLNTPGVWVVSPLFELVFALLPATGSSALSGVGGKITLLALWLLSAVVTYLFWRRLAIPGFRWLIKQGTGDAAA